MKIIANIGSTELLLQATTDEVAQLIGFQGEWARKRNKHSYDFRPGNEIKIHEMFNRLYDQESQASTLAACRSTLLKAAATLEKLEPVFVKIAVPKSNRE